MSLIFEAINKIKIPTDLKDTTEEIKLYELSANAVNIDDTDSIDNTLVLKLQEKAKKLKIKNDNLIKLADHRIQFSWAIFVFVLLFSFFSLMILVCKGNGKLDISDEVIIVLLGTTVINVVGVLYIVTKWLYPQNVKDEN